MEKAEPKNIGSHVRVTVYAASSRRAPETFLAAGRAIGQGLAERGHILVYGGASVGVMGALADGALASGGRVEGVILDKFSEVAHRGLHALETVSSMRARKAGLAELGDAFIALPGAFGTLEEVSEMLVERQLGVHQKPILLLNIGGFWDTFLAFLDRQVAEQILSPENRAIPVACSDVQGIFSVLDSILSSGETSARGRRQI